MCHIIIKTHIAVEVYSTVREQSSQRKSTYLMLIRPAARIALGHDGRFDACYLRFAEPACSLTTHALESTRCSPSSWRSTSIH